MSLQTSKAPLNASRRSFLRYAAWGVTAGGLLASTALLAACGKKKSPRAVRSIPAGSKVLALGDSLTFGMGATPDKAYPTILAGLTGWEVVNAGISGNISQQALDRLPDLLEEHDPELVIVGIGGNDFLRKISQEVTRSNIEAICKQAKASGAQVLLIAMPEVSFSAVIGKLNDHPMYVEIAHQYQIPIQQGGWSRVLSDANLRSDAIHANAQGYAQFAHDLHQTLIEVGLLR